ncbi:MAG: DUF2256 domain-containing protein [Actinomycetia bacterium]|nr:DUF2256 domain-containing protein [Actinomycetes bacterium]
MPSRARAKGGHRPRVCETCGREFEWRKKWERDWANVRYCSDGCRKHRRTRRDPAKAPGESD